MNTDTHIAHPLGRSLLRTYVTGFIISIVLTSEAYLLVTRHWLNGTTLILSIVCLGIIQLFVQLVFFLHLDQETKPRWNLLAFTCAFLVVSILVGGSLWIMHNLNYNMSMSPEEMNRTIQAQEAIQK